ncbi:hypothetical protein [Sphingobium sp.]|uniref:hypothetical protein n=1 Tax=Sphingobium sp. TaxID=1912891 RepID=UPI002C2772D4|nr:hypothetical protein [Sphingobium sp.]HUD95823.1 hypothetical protein [Sphingobium sp.]
MNDETQQSKSSEDPAEGRNEVPPPEKGSPGQATEEVDENVAENVEEGDDDDPNPLAPPINTQAGS